jgi:hypothetical protein
MRLENIKNAETVINSRQPRNSSPRMLSITPSPRNRAAPASLLFLNNSGRMTHRAGRLCRKCSGIVLVHVEGNQRLKRADGVERVQIQPLMLQRTPPRFDHRVGIRDLRHGEKPFQKSGFNQFVDSAVMVLDATVGEHGGLVAEETFRGVDQQSGGGSRVERFRNLPRQDTA